MIYFLGLLGMKLCVFALFQLLPVLGWVGDWALRWTEGREWVQITFVMLVFPLIMNAAQYYIIDSFIKDPAATYDAVEQGEGAEGESEGLIGAAAGGQRDLGEGEGEEGPDVGEDGEGGRKGQGMVEPNPTPLPAYGQAERPGNSRTGPSGGDVDEDDKL